VDQERPEACAGLKDEIQRLYPPERSQNEESFIDKVRTTPANRAGSPRVLYHGQRGERTGGYWPDKAYASKANRDALCDHHRDGIIRTAACYRPLRAAENASEADLQTPLVGLRNAYATMTRRPIVRAGQNKTPSWRWWQSGRTCPANTGNRITRPPKPLCPL